METPQGSSPEERLLRLWQQGRPPALEDFVTDSGVVDARGLAAILRVDQAARWYIGAPIQVEDYLHRYPLVANDPEAAMELILNEFVLSESRGAASDPAEFIRRFPAQAATLRAEIEWYHAVGARTTVETLSPIALTAKLGGTDGLILPRKPATAEVGEAPRQIRDLPNPFGRYRILELLGRGGMGAVYAAYDPQLDRRVALKVPSFAAGDEEGIQNFLREARIAAHFHNPHLCPVYEVGEIDGIFYLSMPVIEGQTLADRLKAAGAFPPEDAVHVVAAIARALEVAHSAGVVHRDLTPANIVLNNEGQPIITDFGLARQSTAPGVNSPDSLGIAGTPAYMAPEQVLGNNAAIGPATDVYALGVVFYEMLTGTRPFDGPLRTLLARIVADDPEPPTSRRADIDERLATICGKALAKEPAERYASMSDLVAALDVWLEQNERADGQRGRRSRRAASALVAVVLALGSALFIWRPWHSTPMPERTPRASAARDPEAALARAELAWRLNNDGDLDRAIEESTGALRLDDRCVSALHCRGNAMLKKKNPQLAVDDLRRAIAFDAANHETRVDLAWAYNDLGDHESSLMQANLAIALDPDSSEAHNQAGWALFKQGRHREAIEQFTSAIQHNPRYAWAYRNRASAYRAINEDALAMMDELKADDLNPPQNVPKDM
ncbi:MAG TPA: protein kinase [Gemmataceae bacterium]|jgi:tetratricopeptide (TPR) repeat protein|nr:protein kinase [Gemmataceae bacterium]